MGPHILILGGNGGVGRALSRNILKLTHCDVTIGGRNLHESNRFAKILLGEYPDKQIKTVYADATQREDLESVFSRVDLVIVTTTTPDHMGTIAEAALETDTDVIDILIRGDVVDKLEAYQERIISEQRIFITQAGFHPGLPAPFIKYAKTKFDNYISANVAMVMNTLFRKPESTYEIIHEITEGNAQISKDGKWKKASYKDGIRVQFSKEFGLRLCYPSQMREIFPLQKELDINNMGVYIAGFNYFVDNVVFPFSVIMNSIKKGAGKKLSAKLMHWGVKRFFKGSPGVEFKLLANGTKNGQKVNYSLTAYSSDPFDFSSYAIIACLNQYLDHTIHRPGLYLMGHVVDERRVIEDLKNMGVQIREHNSINAVDTK